MDFLEIAKLKITNTSKFKEYVNFCYANNIGEKIKGVTEFHHILPKAEGMFPEYKDLKKYPLNGIHLTLANHFEAHRLLVGAMDVKENHFSFLMMCNFNKEMTSKEYSKAKQIYLENHPSKNISNKTKEKLSNSAKKSFENGRVPWNKGVAMTTKTKDKLSKTIKKQYGAGRIPSDYERTDVIKNKISTTLKEKFKTGEIIPAKGMKGKSHSVSTKSKMSIAQKGKPRPTITCELCGKIGEISNMKRWHIPKCDGTKI